MNPDVNISQSGIARDTINHSQNPPKEYKSFLKTIDSAHAKLCAYPTRLDTYGCGCPRNCGYCYARAQLTFRNLWDPKNPRIADIVKIEKELKKIPPGTILRLGGMTDCFQELDLRCKVTLETIKLLNKFRIGYLIVTKSPTVAFPFYLDILNPHLAHIQITVTCLDNEKSKRYEPYAPPPRERIRAILTLQEKSFDVAIRLSPLFEEFMNFDELNSLGIEKCVVEFLRYNGWIKEWLADMSYDFDKYTLYDGNYRHLPLDEKLRIINKVKIGSISVCEKVSAHYDYWQKHFNPNPADCCNLRISHQQNQDVAR